MVALVTKVKIELCCHLNNIEISGRLLRVATRYDIWYGHNGHNTAWKHIWANMSDAPLLFLQVSCWVTVVWCSSEIRCDISDERCQINSKLRITRTINIPMHPDAELLSSAPFCLTVFVSKHTEFYLESVRALIERCLFSLVETVDICKSALMLCIRSTVAHSFSHSSEIDHNCLWSHSPHQVLVLLS